MICEYIEKLVIDLEVISILGFIWSLLVAYRTELTGWEKDKKMLIQAGIALAIPLVGYAAGLAISCFPLDGVAFQPYLIAGAKAAAAVLAGTVPIAARVHRTESLEQSGK